MTKASRGTPLPPARGLERMAGVRRELARLYRQARGGALDVGEASKLANILQILGRMIEGSALEERLAEVERRVGEGGGR